MEKFKALNPTTQETTLFNCNVKILTASPFNHTKEEAEQCAFEETLKNRKLIKRVGRR